MFDAKHRLHVLSSLPEQRDALAQSGLWERLLCDECEGKLSRWEAYASQVLKGGAELRYERVGGIVHVTGIDFAQFRLFQLSILWRAHASSLAFFKKVDLGVHGEKIRLLLNASDPGRYCRYGVLMFGLNFNGSAFSPVIQPAVSRLEGHRAFRFTFGGFQWVYLVSGHDIVPPLAKVILQPSGDLHFQIRDAREHPDLASFAQARRDLKRD
jgi:hypothetical protein